MKWIRIYALIFISICFSFLSKAQNVSPNATFADNNLKENLIFEETDSTKSQSFHSIGAFAFLGINKYSSLIGTGLSYKYRNFDWFSFLPGIDLAVANASVIEEKSKTGIIINPNMGVNFQFQRYFHFRLIGHVGLASDFKKMSVLPGLTTGFGATLLPLEFSLETGVKSLSFWPGEKIPFAQISLAYIFNHKKALK